ncbi:TnpV protein [Ruminococcus callidus]|uniref:TnpV protein n=1 Tax=Ruminococcus callidus TaxID=40519 RepID=UPI0023EF8AFA|nr:TnpV protein [Ruminococcus callidus]
MTEMKKHIYDESNGLWYELIGDYYIPVLTLPFEEQRSIGKWGRMHRDYLKEHRPILFNDLILNGQLWTYLADLNEQAQERLALIIEQMQQAEGVTEDLKAADQMAWIGAMNSIRSRAEEIILQEMIFGEDSV